MNLSIWETLAQHNSLYDFGVQLEPNKCSLVDRVFFDLLNIGNQWVGFVSLSIEYIWNIWDIQPDYVSGVIVI